ncbi:MAG: hypothetical protein LIO86_10780 [Lachnospiraceae bacterium]|nr:hypothetical protein [Lachnospiraceae bacterium]
MKKDKAIRIAAAIVVAGLMLLFLFPNQAADFVDYVQTWVKDTAEKSTDDDDVETVIVEAELEEEQAEEADAEETETVENGSSGTAETGVYDEIFEEAADSGTITLPADTDIPEDTDRDSSSYIRTEPSEDSEGTLSNVLPFISF